MQEVIIRGEPYCMLSLTPEGEYTQSLALISHRPTDRCRHIKMSCTCRDRGEGVAAAATDPTLRVHGRRAARGRECHAPVLGRGARPAPRLRSVARHLQALASGQVTPWNPAFFYRSTFLRVCKHSRDNDLALLN